jgi:hypothetical protein
MVFWSAFCLGLSLRRTTDSDQDILIADFGRKQLFEQKVSCYPHQPGTTVVVEKRPYFPVSGAALTLLF